MKYKNLLICACLLLLCSGCAEKSEKTPPMLDVIMYNVELEEELAQEIATSIKEVIVSSKEGIYVVDNFSFLYHTDPQDIWLNDGVITQMEIHVSADYELSRKPADSPLIQGMYDAKNELQTEEEKERAQSVIDMHCSILEEEGKKQRLEYIFECVFDEDDGYEVTYFYMKDGEGVWIPITEFFSPENTEKMRRAGYELFWLDYN